MKFLNDMHEKRFKELCSRAELKDRDKESLAILYVFAGDDDIYEQVNDIYDFDRNLIKLVFNEESNKKEIVNILTGSGGKALCELAAQLCRYYNSERTISDIFSDLDINNRRLALNALEFRYL